MMTRRGLFIVLYGPEGVGKGRQAELLEEKLKGRGVMSRTVRYPLYEVMEAGPQLDRILHHKTEGVSEEERQRLFAQNRRDFEPTLKSWLNSGVTVIAENYLGTGIVWGVVRGLSQEAMEEIVNGFLESDVAIVIDGPKRGEQAEEHPYADEDEWYKVRKAYLQMADRYGWVRVGGDAPILTVASRVWAVVRPVLAVR